MGETTLSRATTSLPREFFDRPGATVARALLGCRLTAIVDGETRVVRIVETEAYLRGDPASHAFRGPTARNASMFGPPGTLYVYRIHQVHCANVVARRGEAALLRGAEPLEGTLGPTRGPGRLCRALSITRADDGRDLRSGRVTLQPRVAPLGGQVLVGPRVGISRAIDRPLRFAIGGNRYVSAPRLEGDP